MTSRYVIKTIKSTQALEDEFATQLEDQERQAAKAARLPPPPTMPQHSSALHSSRTSLASSHYDWSAARKIEAYHMVVRSTIVQSVMYM